MPVCGLNSTSLQVLTHSHTHTYSHITDSFSLMYSHSLTHLVTYSLLALALFHFLFLLFYSLCHSSPPSLTLSFSPSTSHTSFKTRACSLSLSFYKSLFFISFSPLCLIHSRIYSILSIILTLSHSLSLSVCLSICPSVCLFLSPSLPLPWYSF